MQDSVDSQGIAKSPMNDGLYGDNTSVEYDNSDYWYDKGEFQWCISE